ncbi:MAG: type IV pilus modification PilV family protein [Planctomycetota bacterium]|jgi:type II secretory pathway pseudopilin PulG
MATKNFKRLKGVTLIEVMEAILILSIAVIGASGYRYYSTLDARRADMQSAAARTAMLLCESWRGDGGDTSYNPVTHLGSELSITTISDSKSLTSADFTVLGVYDVVMDNTHYYAALSWKDVSADLRALNVAVAWAQRDRGTIGMADADKVFRLTTYTLN